MSDFTVVITETEDVTNVVVVDLNPDPVSATISETGVQGPPGIQGPPGPEGPEGGTEAMDAISLHLIDETPHPVYDDMPNLVLIFDNHLI